MCIVCCYSITFSTASCKCGSQTMSHDFILDDRQECICVVVIASSLLRSLRNSIVITAWFNWNCGSLVVAQFISFFKFFILIFKKWGVTQEVPARSKKWTRKNGSDWLTKIYSWTPGWEFPAEWMNLKYRLSLIEFESRRSSLTFTGFPRKELGSRDRFRGLNLIWN